ncbi:MAG: NTP transferase domain-containing protein [Candidatus Marinimicrobia bacterium]|nr:NTP transferase domain-containing protein [Candidatus Neomarinimicrobiota bacterium]
MNYKVCILAAGTGSRMLPLTEHFNKALLPVAYKAAISHIIEKFPKEIEIVIAVGHEKNKIAEYLLCAHKNRKVQLVDVDNISNIGSGPGYSLLCCKDHLQCPFIFCSADTIVVEDIPTPDRNWMGVASTTNPEEYCTLAIQEGIISGLDDKIKCNNKDAFIGLAGIKDYGHFFASIQDDNSLIKDELQVSNGFRSLIQKNIYPITFSWHDTGNLEGYRSANTFFLEETEFFDFSKTNEYLYFVGNKVIKYFGDKKNTHNRCLRAKQLRGLCPPIQCETDYFYSYYKVSGKVMYDSITPSSVEKLLLWLKRNLWIEFNLDSKKMVEFKDACVSFYRAKTTARLNAYYKKYNLKDSSWAINGEIVPNASDLLSRIDYEWLSNGVPTKFHGDLQFDNILVTEDSSFILLDWRQDFSGILEYGDMYYDLAKLNGGIYVSYKKIKQGLFEFNEDSGGCFISTDSDHNLAQAKSIFDDFVKENNYDMRKIEILTGIIFLNMAPMHHAPFSHYIYNLGRHQINKWI